MCLAPKAPEAPAPPPEPMRYEAVESKRADERRRQMAMKGYQSTILAGNAGQAATGKTVLGA